MRDVGARCIAGLAAIFALAAGVLVVIALAGLPHPWDGGYVSEAGVAAYPRAWMYRGGIACVSIALILLGATLARARPPIAPALLLAAGILGVVSASVSCSTGCPLPPYEHTTLMDLVHAGASSLAVGLAALGMLAVAVTAADLTMRRLARLGFTLTAPALAALGTCLLAFGRSRPTAVLERVVLAEVLVWMIVTATTLARPLEPHGVPRYERCPGGSDRA